MPISSVFNNAVEGYNRASQGQSLCTLLRIYSRKPKIVALSSLNYEEILG